MEKTASECIQVRSLGEISSADFSVALSDYNYGLRQTWHKHEDFVLAIILKGFVREQVGSRDTLVNPLSIGTKPAGIRHTDHFSDDGVRVLRVSLSPALISELAEKSLIREYWGWELNFQALRPFLRLAAQLTISKPSAVGAFEGLCDGLAALLPEKQQYPSTRPPLWLERARQNLDESFADGVRLTELAREAGVHPVYFARKFRQFFTCSVGRYVRQLQFRKATDLLSNGQKGLAEIAHQIGFSDQAHLTRTFASEFGVTPANLRKLLK